jgi:hypothetical protein
MARPWSMVHLQSSPAHRWNLESALTGACFGAAQAWPQQRLRSRRRSKSTGREFEAPPACHSHDSVTGPPRNARHVSRLAPLAHLHMHKTQMMHRQHGLPARPAPPPPPLRVITSQRAEPRVQTIADTALGCPSAGLPIRPLPIRVGPLIWWNALRCAVHCNAALFPPSVSFFLTKTLLSTGVGALLAARRCLSCSLVCPNGPCRSSIRVRRWTGDMVSRQHLEAHVFPLPARFMSVGQLV